MFRLCRLYPGLAMCILACAQIHLNGVIHIDRGRCRVVA